MKKILEERQIDWLMHFTRADNLSNIFRYGLLPRSILESRNITSDINDYYRYDNCTDAICTTIEFPNYKMFFSLRKDNPGVKWAVLRLDASIIYDFDCAFCSTNAGSEEMYTIPLKERKGKKAFLKMFDELPNGQTRKQLDIDDWYPTNPQAEVLVFDKIPTVYIDKVFFENSDSLEEYYDIIPEDINAKVDSKMFKYRKDWAYW
jgi:hypothetical protein